MQASVTVKTDFLPPIFIITVQGSSCKRHLRRPANYGCPDRTPPAPVFLSADCTCLYQGVIHSSTRKGNRADGVLFPYTRYNRTYHPRALVPCRNPTNGEFSRYPADSLLTGICFVVQHPVRRTRFKGLRTLSGCIQEERGKQIAPPAPARVCSCLRFSR